MKRFIFCAVLVLPVALMGLSCASSSDTSSGRAVSPAAVTAQKRSNAQPTGNNAAQNHLQMLRSQRPNPPQKGS